jgi:hypothetical protein
MSAPHRTAGDDDGNDPLLPLRTVMIFLLALIAAGVVAGLILLAGRSGAESALAGLGALAAGVKFFHWMIAP